LECGTTDHTMHLVVSRQSTK